MTDEEAINTLKSLKDYYNDKNEDSYVGFDNEDNEALDLAIKSLEQQQDVHDTCKKCIEFSEFKQPSEPRTNLAETSQDCISRKAVTDTSICVGISCNECSFNTCEDGQSGCLLKERVDKLPSVYPERINLDVIERIKKSIDEMTEIHSDGEFYIKNVDAKWIIGKYLYGAEMNGGEEDDT